jgi:hypothetical protein
MASFLQKAVVDTITLLENDAAFISVVLWLRPKAAPSSFASSAVNSQERCSGLLVFEFFEIADRKILNSRDPILAVARLRISTAAPSDFKNQSAILTSAHQQLPTAD